MWLVLSIVDSVILDILFFKKDIDKIQFKREVPIFSFQVTIQLWILLFSLNSPKSYLPAFAYFYIW